jgi:hypothetical protein
MDHEPILLSQHEQEVLRYWPTTPVLPADWQENGNKRQGPPVSVFDGVVMWRSLFECEHIFQCRQIARAHKTRFLHSSPKGTVVLSRTAIRLSKHHLVS